MVMRKDMWMILEPAIICMCRHQLTAAIADTWDMLFLLLVSLMTTKDPWHVRIVLRVSNEHFVIEIDMNVQHVGQHVVKPISTIEAAVI